MSPEAAKERPILFSGPMIAALFAGRKTMTRRIVKAKPPWRVEPDQDWTRWPLLSTTELRKRHVLLIRDVLETETDGKGELPAGLAALPCPYGVPGDRLWVRETWRSDHALSECTGPEDVRYAASVDEAEWAINTWRPSIFMPRWASRITLEVTAVRVERLLAITEEAAQAEGVEPFFQRFPEIGRSQCLTTGERAADAEHRASFAVLWDELNGDRALWKSNPWVWVVAFKRVTP